MLSLDLKINSDIKTWFKVQLLAEEEGELLTLLYTQSVIYIQVITLRVFFINHIYVEDMKQIVNIQLGSVGQFCEAGHLFKILC